MPALRTRRPILRRPAQNAEARLGDSAPLWLLAAYAIAFGAILIVLALKARGFVKRIEAAATA